MAAIGVLGLGSAGLSAQTPPGREPPGRYLFIVDTSAGMKRRAGAAQKTIHSLLGSGMYGQMRRGDTVGVWTYNEQLHAGRLPLQQWTPESDELVTSNVMAFLKKQPHEHRPRFDRVWPALQRVIKESERLTVLLITAGEAQIAGTPFDREVNRYFQAQFRDQQKARMPFVVVLRASRGELASMSLNLAQWPVDFPAFPPLPQVVAEEKPKPPEPKPPPPPVAPPLIVIGKKPDAPAEPSSVPVTETPQPKAIESPPAIESPSPPPKPETTAITPPTPVATPIEVASPPTVPAATPALVEVAAVTQPSPPPAGLDFSPVPAASPRPVAEPLPIVPGTVEAKPSAVEPPKAAPLVVTVAETKPATPAVALPPPEPIPAPAPPAPPTSATPTEPESSAAVMSTDATPPTATATTETTPATQVATATPPERMFSLATLLVGGGVLVLLAGVVIFLLLRREREHASLITRSMRQDKE